MDHEEFIASGNAKWYHHFRSQLEGNPAIQFLSVFVNELKSYAHTKTCMWVIIAGLFIIAKHQKQPGLWLDKQTGKSKHCDTTQQ